MWSSTFLVEHLNLMANIVDLLRILCRNVNADRSCLKTWEFFASLKYRTLFMNGTSFNEGGMRKGGKEGRGGLREIECRNLPKK